MAKALLVEVAKKLGKQESQCSFIDRVIEDEWLESLEDLKQVSKDRWEVFRTQYKIPSRFLDTLLALLVDVSPPRGETSDTQLSVSSSKISAVAPIRMLPSNVGELAWATPNDFHRMLRKVWDFDMGAPSPAFRSLLMGEENIRTYGVLGKPLDDASLGGIVAFTKAAWGNGKVSSVSSPLPIPVSGWHPDMTTDFDPLGLLTPLTVPRPKNMSATCGADLGAPSPVPPARAGSNIAQGEHYGVALVVGDCCLHQLRERMVFANQMLDQGAFGVGCSVHVAVGDIGDSLHEVTSQVFNTDVKVHVTKLGEATDAAALFRGWLSSAMTNSFNQALGEELFPLVLVTSQPHALHHRLAFDNVVREKAEWLQRCPPSLVHVAASGASLGVTREIALDALARVLGQLGSREERLNAARARL